MHQFRAGKTRRELVLSFQLKRNLYLLRYSQVSLDKLFISKRKIGVLQKAEIRGKEVFQLINPDTKEILIEKVNSADLTKATADGIWAGYGTGFLGNIAQGLWWASVAVGVIQLVGGFVDDDGALTKALSGAAFGGIVGGKKGFEKII